MKFNFATLVVSVVAVTAIIVACAYGSKCVRLEDQLCSEQAKVRSLRLQEKAQVHIHIHSYAFESD
jgi:hypothetical protein